MKKLKFKLDALREEMEILNMDDLISTKGGGAAGYYGYSTWEDFIYAVDHGNVPDGTYFPDGVSGGYGVHGDYGNLPYLHLDAGYGTWNAGGYGSQGGYGGYGNFDTSVFNNSNVQSTISLMRYGSGGIIRDVEGAFSIFVDPDTGAVSTSAIEFGADGNSVHDTVYPNAKIIVHSHVESNNPPSAQDIITMALRATGTSPNLEASYAVTQDGGAYGMLIDDKNKLLQFYNANKNDVNPDGSWKYGTAMYNNYNNALQSYINNGYSLDEGMAKATAFILKSAGVNLIHAPGVPSASGNFQQVNY